MNDNHTYSSKKFTDDEIIESFKTFDLDKNNYIGVAELRHVLINIGLNPSDEEIDEMIRMVDTDGDGQVGWNEFYHMVSDGKKCERDIFNNNLIKPQGKNIIEIRNKKIDILNNFVNEYNLKYESIKKAYILFVNFDKDKSGVLDFDEFCQILQIEPTFLVKEAFTLFDYNKSGLVDIREFLICLLNFTSTSNEDKLNFSFRLYMNNNNETNGIITKSELLKIIKNNHIASHDSEVIKKVQMIMTHLDKDGFGVITFDKFINGYKKFPNIFFPAYNRKNNLS